MPSLAQLEEFKSSFKDVGNEASIMSNNPMLIEDFELPEDDPPSPFPDGLEGGDAPEPGPTLRVSDLGLDLPPESFNGGDDSGSGFDFGPFLDGDLDNVDPSDSGEPGGFEFDNAEPDSAEAEHSVLSPDDSFDSPDTEFPGMDIPDIDIPDMAMPDMDMPEDLLSGFSDDLESGGLPIDEEIPSTSDSFGGSLPDFGEPADFETDSFEPGSAAGEPEAPLAMDSGPGFNTGDTAPPSDSGDFSGLEFPGIDLSEAVDMGGESIGTPGVPADEEDSGDFSFPDLESDLPSLDDSFPEPDDGSADKESDSQDEAYDLSEAGDFSTEEIVLPGEDAGSFDLDLPDFNSGGLSGGDDFGGTGAELPGIDSDFGALPESESPGDSDFGDLDFDTSAAEHPGAGDFDSAGFGADGSVDFGMAEAGADFDGGIGSESPAEDFAADTEGFPDLPAPSAVDETQTEGADAFDQFTSGGDWTIPDTTLETPDFTESAAPDELGDFSLSGFDAPDEKGKPEQSAASPAGFSDEVVEEIHLGEEEFRQLQDTLSSYPLNLRVACEELIVEQAVAPDKMSALIKLLVRGAPAKETAALAGKILGRTIPIPKGYAKQTGAELEAEQASLGYIFTKRFLPALRLAGAIVLVVASLAYLIWRFAIIPFQAERLYKEGQELILSGAYPEANERFRQGFEKHRVKKWFYRYAETFRDERQYIYAEQKYDELLRVYPRDKKGALDYAALETNVIRNYEKADRIIRTNILDYAVNDREGLLALAETNLAWGETDASRYEEARGAYARLMERYGRKDPYLEGMLKYFIRTDKLGEVIPLQNYFMSEPKKRKITVPTLAELGGYLLDKRFEETGGVPEEHVDKIEGIRDVLIRAIEADRTYPESYYHLARYNFRYGLEAEERQSLQDAIRAFSDAREETPKRTAYHIDARRRYGEVLIKAREFFPAEEELIRGVRLYEDARARGMIKNPRPEFGRLYAVLGDLEFFAKSGDMDAALRFYTEAERNNWAPPEIQYRMGAANYQNGDFEEALRRFFTLSSVMPNNRRLLYALGNAAYLRGNYFAAQGYYNRLMDLLDSERVRFPDITPGGRPEEQDLAERIMVADNNLGVTLEALTRVSGDTGYRTRALYLFSESIRAWDVLTRDPDDMTRMRPIKELYSPGINLAYLNAQNILQASPSYEQQIFMRIDRDCLEPSDWETLVPRDYRLSDQLPITVE